MSQKQNNNNSSNISLNDISLNDISLNQKPKMYGWFSQKQLDKRIRSNALWGLRKDKRKRKYPKYNIYLTVDGREVDVTYVSKSNNKADFKFDDIQFKGEVVKWIRTIF